ncbi:hypothetical protein COLO4_34399 [Corchorus olitorius]|uniref:Uncharacterized protein n=1 Tax=Corchorus olitorius TaxID=93759 RepID=A0A1R3GL40_9ROSI|nr:hypothetical protein COLO4_34399 [Corchorus olitorius]
MRNMVHDIGRANADYVHRVDVDMTNATSTRDSSSTLNEEADGPIRGSPTSPNDEAAKFYRLLQELQQVLYPGCEESSTLSFIVEVLNWKCLYGIN